MSSTTVDLVVRLGLRTGRAEAAAALAERLGIEDFLLFVRDAALDVMIPAPGFPQTLRGGPIWREFLVRCRQPGRHAEIVDLPPGTSRPARALVTSGVGALLLGGTPHDDELRTIESLLPLVGAALDAEQQMIVAAAEALEARGAASSASTLASALEASRAEGARLNERLREEHLRKDEFLAMLAHELRNPLTPLVSSIELLQRGGLDPAAATRQFEVMARQVHQLARLVEDLLDVSRVSRGRIELRRNAIDVGTLVRDAMESSRPLLDARRHVIELSLPRDPVVVNVDPVRITQVVANLLNNAAKYTDPGGRIAVRVKRDGNQAAIDVEDNGLGISAEMLPRVFDLFVQAPVSLERAQGGLGIGLRLVRMLVELHGGHVTAESAGMNRGSRFTVFLPAPEGGLAPEARAVPSTLAGRRDQVRPLRVLVVDDNRDAADTLALILEMTGNHVGIAYSGLKALQIAADLDPDLILLDIGLPELDGYEVARRLRRIARRHVWLVALTGYGSEEDKRRAREAGFDEHIVKPVGADTMQKIVACVGSKLLASVDGA
jgi:signal transduction histidine kinase